MDPIKRRRRRLLLVALVALACLAGVGYTRLGPTQDRMMSAAVPLAPAEGAPRPPAAEGDNRPAGREEAPTHKGGGETVRAAPVAAMEKTCDDAMVLVDRSHTLPPEYVPEDLVSLPGNGVPTLGEREMLLRKEATGHLGDLVSAAAAAGEELVVASAFRSYEVQKLSYGRLRSIYGAGADAMSATPGHSQHQLGTAVDFANASAGYQVHPSFGYTSAYLWLRDHATEYGFVLAYPPGGGKSGYEWEPWHYRYIGVENAGRLEKSNLSLQEFLVRKGVLPNC
ncbi:MAG: M15 family metallopeptidase [Rubrobacter sp.]